jgi:hypothetical protein
MRGLQQIKGSDDMKPSHAVALALVGWYLMVPPSKGDLNQSCRQSLAGSDDISAAQFRRCNPLWRQLADDAPLSKWRQAGEFEKLSDCQERDAEIQAESTQLTPFNEKVDRDLAKEELLGEGTAKPSEDELMSRVWAFRRFYQAQDSVEKCIASDDSRLKEH